MQRSGTPDLWERAVPPGSGADLRAAQAGRDRACCVQPVLCRTLPPYGTRGPDRAGPGPWAVPVHLRGKHVNEQSGPLPASALTPDMVDRERGQESDSCREAGEVMVLFKSFRDHGVGKHGQNAASGDRGDEGDKSG